PAWKARLDEVAHSLAKGGPVSMNVLMERALAEPGMRDRAKEVAAYAKKLGEELRHAKPDESVRAGSVEEFAMFRENVGFLGSELCAQVGVFGAGDPERRDPAGWWGHAVAGR